MYLITYLLTYLLTYTSELKYLNFYKAVPSRSSLWNSNCATKIAQEALLWAVRPEGSAVDGATSCCLSFVLYS